MADKPLSYDDVRAAAERNLGVLREHLKDNKGDEPPPPPTPDSLEARVSRLESRNKMIATLVMLLVSEIMKDVEPDSEAPTPVIAPY